MEVLHELVRVVARSFYDDKYVIVLDSLVRDTMIPDDVLIERMQIVIRDFNRVTARLREDRLIKCEARQEPRADTKMITRTYYFIDYKQFVDVVKFRIYKMRNTVEEMIKKEMESRGYFCPTCNKIFGSLDVGRLLNPRSCLFECDACVGVELQVIDTSARTTGPHELHSRLMDQIKGVLGLLKRTEGLSIPIFSPFEWLRDHGSKYSLVTGLDDSGQDKGKELAIAGANNRESMEVKVSVELFENDGKSGGEGKKESISLPAWHTHSTVSGEVIRTTEKKNNSELVIEEDKDLDGLREERKKEDISEITQYYSNLQSKSTEVVIESFDDFESTVEEPSSKNIKLTTESESLRSKQVEVESSSSSSNDPLISVAGQKIPFTSVTEEDKNRMTEEEYSHYFEVYMTLNQ